MKIEGEFTFQGPRDEVWKLLLDPEVLVNALPGAEKMEKVGEDKYESIMQVKVGPVAGKFSGKVAIQDKEEPSSYKMKIEGKGGPGFAKGGATIQLSEADNNSTLMKYNADLQIGGRLASVGQRLLDTVSKSMTRQSLEAINQALQERLGTSDGEKSKAPSQNDFVKGVIKDVLSDAVNQPMFWVTVIVSVSAIVLAITTILSFVAKGG